MLAVSLGPRKQVDAGIDIVTDGELGKNSFTLYGTQRLDGLTPNAVPLMSLVGAAGRGPPARSPEERGGRECRLRAANRLTGLRHDAPAPVPLHQPGGVPKVDRASSGSPESRAPQHSRRQDSLPHLLGERRWPAPAHVEHPELVAQRIVHHANIVGRENMIPAPDCGFDTFVGLTSVGEDVVWMKFDSLVKGAEIASNRLW
jgi:hypothetical protein